MFQSKISTKNQSKLSTRRAQDDLERCLALGAFGASGECHMSCKEPPWVAPGLSRWVGPSWPTSSTMFHDVPRIIFQHRAHGVTECIWIIWMHDTGNVSDNSFLSRIFRKSLPQSLVTVRTWQAWGSEQTVCTGSKDLTTKLEFMEFSDQTVLQLSPHHHIFSVSDQTDNVVTRCKAHRLLGTVGIRCRHMATWPESGCVKWQFQ